MTRFLATDVAANMTARAWAAGLTLAATPFYLHLLGVETYALVGAYSVLQTIFVIFDFGLGLSLNKQLATHQPAASSYAQVMRDTVHSFELVYWVIGLAGFVLFTIAAGPLSAAWLVPHERSLAGGTLILQLMAGAIALQWPSTLYVAGLLGMGRQVRASVVTSIFATMRVAGSVIILNVVAPSITVFFAWQIVAGGLQSLALRTELLRALPQAARRQFRRSILLSNMSFAVDLTLISILGVAITQVDKVLLLSIVSLEAFGYYVVAGTLAAGLYTFSVPVFNAVFPRLVAAAAEVKGLAKTYHRACQAMALAVLPPACCAMVFAPELIRAWLDDSQAVDATVLPFRILVMGTALNGVLNVPFALALAVGWSRLPLLMNAGALLVLCPTIVALSFTFGMVGAAATWLGYNVAYGAIALPIMHRRVLEGHLRRWYLNDLARPLAGAFVGAAIIRAFAPEPNTRVGALAVVACGAASSIVGAVLFTELGERALGSLLHSARVSRKRERSSL